MINVNRKKFVPLAIAICILITVVAVSSNAKINAPSAKPVSSSTADSVNHAAATPDRIKKIATGEMRGMWVTYMELDMENESDKSEKAFRAKFSDIAEKSRNSEFNTLIVQVRPFCDALYKSEYFPWSHIITGTQGKNPGYDPLKIMCEISKSYGMKIQAWVNPYRISSNKTPSALSDDNPYQKDSSLGKKANGGIFFDPSNEKARQLIENGVAEIVKNYDVDGVQFDDYFYPTDDEDFDKDEYDSYVSNVGENNSMSLENWRTANVNLLVCETYRAVHSNSKNTVFGISPQGNINNNKKLYADVKSWCSCKGFVDYICPQIYFSINNPALTFENSLKSWSNLEYDKNVTLYVGLAGYKAGTDDDENTWSESSSILANEYKMLKENKLVKGIMLYSYSSLLSSNAEKEINNLKKALN